MKTPHYYCGKDKRHFISASDKARILNEHGHECHVSRVELLPLEIKRALKHLIVKEKDNEFI